jgi:cobalt-zinc-cadmium efflux system outer membrane protein
MHQICFPDAAKCCIRRDAEPVGIPRSTPTRLMPALALSVVLTLAATFWLAGISTAEVPDAHGSALELQDALARAVAHNKELAAFEHRLKEQDGRVEQAGLFPNPVLQLTVEDFAGNGDFEGFDRSQTTLSLGWVLERSIRRGRIAAAEAGSALLLTDAAILRLDVAAETAQRFLNCLANQARIENANEAVSLAEDTVSAVKRRVRAGKSPQAELSRAEAELATANLSYDDVEHELAIAHHRLAAQWGEWEEAELGFSRVNGGLLKLPTMEPFLNIQGRLEQNPRLARFVSEERVAKANIRLAETKRWPSLRPSVGVRRLETTDDFSLVAGLSIPLPVLNRNQGRLSESRATLSRTRAEAAAARVRVHTALFEVYEELQHHIHRAEMLRDEVIPRLSKALNETRRGYEKGRYSYFEWRSVQADLLEAKSELIEASTGAHRLVIALERLTGERVAKS